MILFWVKLVRVSVRQDLGESPTLYMRKEGERGARRKEKGRKGPGKVAIPGRSGQNPQGRRLLSQRERGRERKP